MRLMSLTQDAQPASDRPGIPWAQIGGVMLAVFIVFGTYRYYQHMSSFTAGRDYFEPEFQIYWMNLLYTQLVVVAVFGAGLFSWLWMTRDKNVMQISPKEELRRYYTLIAMLFFFAFIAYLTASVYTEADAAWHQVTVRDTDFTPTHIALFYFGIPVFIIAGVAAFIWAHTRLPQYHGRISLPFALVVAGPILIMPNLGFNEWGHTFFYAEELFAAPIHWGFVLLGWATFASAGLLMQMLARLAKLTELVAKPTTA